MYLLFLDTETTGLSPTSSQIIEIAGIVARLDKVSLRLEIVDGFESLVALRGEMDDKITRITGITKDDLQIAPTIFQVQEKWSEFLNGYDEVFVVGHSIGFDMGFLKNESWYLPPGTKTIDTLDIAKIAFPNLNAVNLEYLIDQLKLSPNASQIEDLKLGKDLILNPHRALYDTICCLNLLGRALTRISEFGLSQEFYTKFDNFLGLSLEYYSKEGLEEVDSEKIDRVNLVGLDGKIIPIGMWSKIQNLGSLSIEKQLNSLLQKEYKSDYLLILMQIFVINRLKINSGDIDSNFKIHTKNALELVFAELILDYLVADKNDARGFELVPIETIIPNLRLASENSYHFGRFVTLVEMYLDIFIDSEDLSKETQNLLRKIISNYDFLLLGLQPLYQRGEYQYNYTTLEPEEVVVQRKLVDFENLLAQLKNIELPFQGEVTKMVGSAIKKMLNGFYENDILQINAKNRLTFRYFRNQLYINLQVKYFDIPKHFDQIFEKYPDLTITSYLDSDTLVDLLDLVNIRNKIQLSEVKFLNQNDNKLEIIEEDTEFGEFVRSRIEDSKSNNGISLILGGQNSTIRDSERVLTKNHSPKDYLLLGESGSLTKILSKMQNGFNGLVVVKIGDFGYLSRFVDDYNLDQIWIVNPPYFNINGYWFGMAKRSDNKEGFMKELKRIYLHYQTSMINQKTGLIVKYLRSYRT